MKGYHGWVSGL